MKSFICVKIRYANITSNWSSRCLNWLPQYIWRMMVFLHRRVEWKLNKLWGSPFFIRVFGKFVVDVECCRLIDGPSGASSHSKTTFLCWQFYVLIRSLKSMTGLSRLRWSLKYFNFLKKNYFWFVSLLRYVKVKIEEYEKLYYESIHGANCMIR